MAVPAGEECEWMTSDGQLMVGSRAARLKRSLAVASVALLLCCEEEPTWMAICCKVGDDVDGCVL